MTTLLYIGCGWLALNAAFVLWRVFVGYQQQSQTQTHFPHAGRWTHAS
ncbi:hypothetical protein [Bradyrhizobium prioriisuperbiae]|nr:hypothetical protein [Bradyrhizobium prioritasuperba]